MQEQEQELLKRVAPQCSDVVQLLDEGSEWVARLTELGLLRPGDTVLDYGAGLGRMTIPLLKAGYAVTPVDECPLMRDWLQQRIHWTVRTPEEMTDTVHSVALLCFVLQHNSPADVRQILRRLSFIAHRLLFTVPTFSQWKTEEVPPGFVLPREVLDAVLGLKERTSAIYRDEELPELFLGSLWDTETLSRVPGFGGGLWAIDSRGI